jgi:4-hydroxybenzoate polyprenyltransferase
MQLVILFYALTQIIHPLGVNPWVIVMFFMSGIITTEIGRKMYSVEEDTTDDTYSAQLGHRGSAVAISVMAVAMTLLAFYLIGKGVQNYLFIIGPVLALGLVVNNAYHYAIEPNKKHADNIEKVSNLMYVVCMLSVIVGA